MMLPNKTNGMGAGHFLSTGIDSRYEPFHISNPGKVLLCFLHALLEKARISSRELYLVLHLEKTILSGCNVTNEPYY